MSREKWMRVKWILFAVAWVWEIGFATGFFLLMASGASGLFWKLLLVYLAWAIPDGFLVASVFHAEFVVGLNESDEKYNSEGHMRYETQTKSDAYFNLDGDLVITEQESGRWVQDTQNSLGKFTLCYLLLFPILFLVDGIIILIRLIWQTHRLKKH